MTAKQGGKVPDWKKFLRFGEKLIQQESATAQCRFVQKSLAELLDANAQIWLAQPNYPLPGEPAPYCLPDNHAPEIVQQCFSTRKAFQGDSKAIIPVRKTGAPIELALPLITHQVLLGVLHVSRPAEAFSLEDKDYLEGLAAHTAQAMQIVRQTVIKNWRFDQLALVRSVSAKTANLHDPADFVRQVTRLIQKAFHYYYVAIFTLDEHQQALTFQASAAQNQRKARLPIGYKIKVGDGIIGTAAETGVEVISADVRSDPVYHYQVTIPETVAEVALPLRIGARVLGVLDLQSDQPNTFHEYDMLVLRALADNIATAMESQQLVVWLQKRADQISALLEISHTLTSILEFDPLLDQVVQSIKHHFGYAYVHIFIIHYGQRRLVYEAGSGARSQEASQRHLTYDLDSEKGMIPWVARNGKTLLANDVSQEPLYVPSDLPPKNTMGELAIPLSFAGEVLGVLDLQSEQVNKFAESDIPLLEALSASIAIAIRNARLYRSEVWRRQVTESFQEITSLVSANAALDNLLEKILTELDRSLPCDATAIWLLDSATPDQMESLHPARVHGVEMDQLRGAISQNPESKQFLVQVLDKDAPAIRKAGDPHGPLGLALDFPEDYSSIAAPLRAGDKPLGAITLAHHTPRRYGSEARIITMTFANNAATAIQNNQLFTAAQEQAWISTILLQIAEATQGNQSVEELFETMVRLTPLLVGIKKCAFFLYDDFQEQFSLKAQHGLTSDRSIGMTFGLENGLALNLVNDKQAVYIENPQEELHLADAAPNSTFEKMVVMPLQARGRLLGAFLVGYDSDNHRSNLEYDQQMLALLQGIAQQTAIALENLELIEARQEEAYVTAVLLQVAQAVVSQNSLNDILDTIVHLMPILIGIDACAIYLWEEKSAQFRTAKVFTGSATEETILEGETFQPGEFPMLDYVRQHEALTACKIEDSEVTVDDWRDLKSLLTGDALETEYSMAYDWVMGVPLSIKGEVYGVMLAKEANVPATVHERRLEILNGIAQQVALAIQNERLNEEMVQRERLEREIQLARQIQKTFLPSRLPKFDGWEIEIHWQTAREVGGDFYDVFRLAKDRVGLVIADVSDKGMPAALYMTVARTLIRAFSQKAESPAHVLERVNRLLVVDSQDGLFVTAVFAILNTETGQLTYANAGHNLPILLQAQPPQISQLEKGSTALGIYTSTRFSDHQAMIEPSGSVIFYTDGLTESFSPDGESFGEERLLDTLKTAPQSNASVIMDYLRKQVNDFRYGAPPSDDMTIVLVHRQAARAAN
jgi:serine phosphatase RsbU (regulator of sigma subunit)/putative methionine-R-sulfoxide reductase with GAF domain